MKGSRLLATVSGGALAIAAYDAGAQQQSTETYQYDALGRVISAKTVGGINNNETHSICYDAAGNRVKYKASSDGTAPTCVSQGTQGGTPAPTPSPSPTPTPTPANNPPVTQNDTVSGHCYLSTTVNLTANDSDPEGNTPLVLQSIGVSSGEAAATIVSGSSVRVAFGPAFDITQATYTVADSLGATSTGVLNIRTVSCNDGGLEF